MIDLRLRVKVSAAELEAKVGKILGPSDFNVLLTGPTFVRMPDNRPLAVYLPGALRKEVEEDGVYDILHSLKAQTTNNRGVASGSQRFQTRHGAANGGAGRTYSRKIASAVVGAVDPQGQKLHCRLTAWTGTHLPQWRQLQPLLQAVADAQRKYVPQRAAAQWAEAEKTDPSWIVPGTPFSTVTVNNTYPTGVHTDKGDLDAGFSTIACLRRGSYTGGQLVFPEYRVAVDMRDGDLLLMDAHQWHGNVALVCQCGREPNGACAECGAERISVVSYFRTKITRCGTPDEELRKATGVR
jgi:2-oxoglutarate-Fe(II)-dependent dioxygenase family protein